VSAKTCACGAPKLPRLHNRRNPATCGKPECVRAAKGRPKPRGPLGYVRRGRGEAAMCECGEPLGGQSPVKGCLTCQEKDARWREQMAVCE
jgi:hypothetical protein